MNHKKQLKKGEEIRGENMPDSLPVEENVQWYELLKDIGVKDNRGIYKESDVHPHVEEEKANLFHTPDGMGTEIEVLHFLQALMILYKPRLVLETGTYTGIGTLSIASGLVKNGFGKVITIEREHELAEGSKKLFKNSQLDQFIELVEGSSFDYIDSLDDKTVFDVVFFDTRLKFRISEFEALLEKGCLGNLVIFHDSSRLRGKTRPHEESIVKQYVKDLDRVAEEYCSGQIEFPYSRGMRLMQIKKDVLSN